MELGGPIKRMLGWSVWQWFSSLSVHQNPLEGLLKQMARPHSQGSDSIGLRSGLKICICNKSPGDTDRAHLRATL